jgi:hypothetical protein
MALIVRYHVVIQGKHEDYRLELENSSYSIYCGNVAQCCILADESTDLWTAKYVAYGKEQVETRKELHNLFRYCAYHLFNSRLNMA